MQGADTHRMGAAVELARSRVDELFEIDPFPSGRLEAGPHTIGRDEVGEHSFGAPGLGAHAVDQLAALGVGDRVGSVFEDLGHHPDRRERGADVVADRAEHGGALLGGASQLAEGFLQLVVEREQIGDVGERDDCPGAALVTVPQG